MRSIRLRDEEGHRQELRRLPVPHADSPPDCTGCGNCVGICPVNQKSGKTALEMKPLTTRKAQEAQEAQEANWEYRPDSCPIDQRGRSPSLLFG